MGATLSSYSHSVACELLHSWRQATVIMVGCFFIFFVLTHSVDYFSTHRFQILPVTASPSGCPFGFPCGRPSRTECFTKYSIKPFLRSALLLYGTFLLFSLPAPRNS
jgi:hypothetical protein